MRASLALGAILPSLALAGGYGDYSPEPSAPAPPAEYGQPSLYTVHVTSTVTGTVTNTLTAYLTKNTSISAYPAKNTSTSAYPAKNTSTSAYPTIVSKFNSTKPVPTFSKPTTLTTSAGPVEVTTNAAPRGAIDAAMAGIVGAALYLVL